MMSLMKSKPILFLKGTFKSDCKNLDQLIEEKYSESINDNFIQPKYDKPPKYFESLDKWPKSLNIICPICTKSCINQDGPLYAIPKGFDSNGKIPLFGVIFNTPVCAAKFISIYLSNSEIFKNYLLSFHTLLTQDIRKIEFLPTGDHWEIDFYGGDRTVDDWLKIQIYNDQIFYKLFKPDDTKSKSKSKSKSSKIKKEISDDDIEDLEQRIYEHMGCQEDLYSEDTGYANS